MPIVCMCVCMYVCVCLCACVGAGPGCEAAGCVRAGQALCAVPRCPLCVREHQQGTAAHAEHKHAAVKGNLHRPQGWIRALAGKLRRPALVPCKAAAWLPPTPKHTHAHTDTQASTCTHSTRTRTHANADGWHRSPALPHCRRVSVSVCALVCVCVTPRPTSFPTVRAALRPCRG